MGSVAKSYMRKSFLIYEEMRKYLTKYEEALTLQPLHSEFPYIRGKFDFIFYQCASNIKEHYTVFLLNYFYDCSLWLLPPWLR
jgi:hypothetical protein